MNQVDNGHHNPPWWARSVQDHLGPCSDIFLMLDKVDTRSLGISLMTKGIPSYMVDWISSCISERTCTSVC